MCNPWEGGREMERQNMVESWCEALVLIDVEKRWISYAMPNGWNGWLRSKLEKGMWMIWSQAANEDLQVPFSHCLGSNFEGEFPPSSISFCVHYRGQHGAFIPSYEWAHKCLFGNRTWKSAHINIMSADSVFHPNVLSSGRIMSK